MPADSPPVQLPDGYYLDNFNTLIDFVARHYQTLLSDRERHFYQRYQSLDTAAQQLYIRLLSRSKSLFRRSRLQYDEIDDIDQAIAALEKKQLAFLDPQLSIDTMLQLFTRTELAAALGHKGQSARRAKLQQAVSQQPQALALLRRHEHIVAVMDEQIFVVFRLLFFGNLHQDLTAFVLRDLGLQRYEPYQIDTGTLPFRNREQIERHLHYYQCREAYDVASAKGPDALLALHHQLPGADDSDPVLKRRTDKLAIAIARQLEREQANAEAMAIYSTIERPPSRERLTRLIAKGGDNATALDRCQNIIDNPGNTEELQFATQFGRRLAKKSGRSWPAAAPSAEPRTTTITLAQTGQSVEICAAEHFRQWGQCYYVENALITGVLGLCIWDIIFAPLQGAFYHPFQHAPADFQEPEFRIRREAALQDRFRELQNGAMAQLVRDNWQSKFGIGNPLVSWRYLSAEIIDIALERIPYPDWHRLFKYLLKDLRNHRTGLPDLAFFPAAGGYQFIEVKGPGDKLQNNQRRWMAYFRECAIEHSVLNVTWLCAAEHA